MECEIWGGEMIHDYLSAFTFINVINMLITISPVLIGIGVILYFIDSDRPLKEYELKPGYEWKNSGKSISQVKIKEAPKLRLVK